MLAYNPFGMATAHQSGAVLLVYAEPGYDVQIYFHQQFVSSALVKYASCRSTLNQMVRSTYFLESGGVITFAKLAESMRLQRRKTDSAVFQRTPESAPGNALNVMLANP